MMEINRRARFARRAGRVLAPVALLLLLVACRAATAPPVTPSAAVREATGPAAVLLSTPPPAAPQATGTATDTEIEARPAPSLTPAAPAALPSATAVSRPAAPSPTVTPAAAPLTPAPLPQAPAPATQTAALSIYPNVPTAPPYQTYTPTPTRTPGPTPAVDVVVDDADPSVNYSGAWFAGDGGMSYHGGCHWAPPGANFANFKPPLPAAGSYEIYAWGCGDPNHDQAYLTNVSVYPFRAGFYVPPHTAVDLKDDPGRWVSVGIYYMEPGGWVSVGASDARSWGAGNLVADAFRFVFRSPDHVDITPTPAPTRITWTNHPPSPEEQLTSGDLTARLGLVHWLYQYAPAQLESMTFDDCQAFPRTGCGGTRPGFRVTVRYEGREPFSVVYRVSEDRRHVSLDAPDTLRSRQVRYLFGLNGTRRFDVLRYPDGSFQLLAWDEATGGGSAAPLGEPQVGILRDLAGKYASIGTGRDRVITPDGWELRLYGFGARVAPDDDDRARLTTLAGELGALAGP